MPGDLFPPRPKRYRYPFALEREIRNLILDGRRQEALSRFETLWVRLRENCPTIRHLKSDAIHYSAYLIRKCIQSDLAVNVLQDFVLPYSTSLIEARSATEIRSVVLGLTEHLLRLAGGQRLLDRREKVRWAIRYVDTHCLLPLAPEDVAEVSGLSVTYFNRVFLEETGMTLQAYLARLRMEKAKTLLLTSALTVKEVADQVGYRTPSSFSRAFKHYTMETPRQFAQSKQPR